MCVMPIYCEDEQEWMNIGVAVSERQPEQYVEWTALQPRHRSASRPHRQRLPGAEPDRHHELLHQRRHAAFLGLLQRGLGPTGRRAQYEMQYDANSFQGGLPRANGTLPKGVQSLGDLYFDGFYVEVLYFLTRGDHHRVVVKNPSF